MLTPILKERHGAWARSGCNVASIFTADRRGMLTARLSHDFRPTLYTADILAGSLGNPYCCSPEILQLMRSQSLQESCTTDVARLQKAAE
jgi:hypothetical protein